MPGAAQATVRPALMSAVMLLLHSRAPAYTSFCPRVNTVLFLNRDRACSRVLTTFLGETAGRQERREGGDTEYQVTGCSVSCSTPGIRQLNGVDSAVNCRLVQ